MMKSSTYDDFSRDCEILNNQNNHVEVKTVDIDFPECRGMTFRELWDWFPNKLPFYDYEEELTRDMEETKHLWIKKCAGLGITEWMLRRIAWYCLKDDEWKNSQVDVNIPIIVGPRLDLAITIIQRLKDLFPQGSLRKTKETTCILNGNIIKVYPSHHVATAHGLNPKLVFLDEGDLFPIGQQQEAREVAERYIAKTNPYIIWISTPYLPGGLYETIENEKKCLYRRKIMLLDRALKSGRYTQSQVDVWEQSPSFMREAWGEYGYGLGDIFVKFDNVITEYDLNYMGGRAGTYGDPGFGSSKFGKIAAEMRDGMIYVTEAEEYERESPSRMLDVMEESWNKHGQSCKVDASNPGFIKDLNNRGIPALGVAFGETVPETEGSNTTITLRKKMPINASVMVKNRLVRIHPSFKSLISQMREVKFDKMWGIDKSEVPFDLVDALDMMLWDMQGQDFTAIGITYDGRVIGVPTKHSKTTVTTRIV